MRNADSDVQLPNAAYLGNFALDLGGKPVLPARTPTEVHVSIPVNADDTMARGDFALC